MHSFYALLQKSPINGWITVIGGVGSVLFGTGALILGYLSPEVTTQICTAGAIDPKLAVGFIFGGLTALGLGNKMEKFKAALLK